MSVSTQSKRAYSARWLPCRSTGTPGLRQGCIARGLGMAGPRDGRDDPCHGPISTPGGGIDVDPVMHVVPHVELMIFNFPNSLRTGALDSYTSLLPTRIARPGLEGIEQKRIGVTNMNLLRSMLVPVAIALALMTVPAVLAGPIDGLTPSLQSTLAAPDCSGGTTADVDSIAGPGDNNDIIVGASGCFEGTGSATVSWSDGDSQQSGSCTIDIGETECTDSTRSGQNCATVDSDIENQFGSRLDTDFEMYCK